MEAIDNIIGFLIKWTKEKQPINPELWIESAMKLNVLKEDALNDHIIALDESLAKKRYNLLLEGKTVAWAKTAIEADSEYVECKRLQVKLKMIEEHIKLCKKRASMGSDNYNSY